MDVAVFSTKPHDREYLDRVNADFGFDLTFFEPPLDPDTVPLAEGFEVASVFVHDELDAETCGRLAQGGTRLIALRCAGFNNVDLEAAEKHGLSVARVPAYSPYAVAEHTVGLILTLSRKFHRAYHRVRDGNLQLTGLLGFEVHGSTVGIVGTGKIGCTVLKVLGGFGCRLLAYDPYPSEEAGKLGARYVEFDELLRASDIITLHCPLVPETHHLIDSDAFSRMKNGVVLINTSRGGLVDTGAAIRALKSGKLGYLGLDVYEEEADLFYEDLSDRVIQDDVFARLLTFPNVLITAHQAFFTAEALTEIATTTLQNIADHDAGRLREANRVTGRHLQRKPS